MDEVKTENEDGNALKKETSMTTLVVWNVSKALKENPSLDLKVAITNAEKRLNSDSRNVNTMTSEHADERYLMCALLAWQELGHSNVDSLCSFVQARLDGCESKSSEILQKPTDSRSDKIVEKSETPCHHDEFSCNRPKCTYKICSKKRTCCHDTSLENLCVRRPATNRGAILDELFGWPRATNIVMKVENPDQICSVCPPPPPKKKEEKADVTNKIDEACCMDNACMEQLAALGKLNTDLRMRAARLARREAKRTELLERAEAAWDELERGYQRRLQLAEEKEEDMKKQIEKFVKERNDYKEGCTTITPMLTKYGEDAEQERVKLREIEKVLYERAEARLRQRNQCKKTDDTLTDLQIKSAQLDRDNQFKEQQAMRKLTNMDTEVNSARALTLETERALRAELNCLRQQITQISNQLLDAETENSAIQVEIEDLEDEKKGLVEDLESCQAACEDRMQDQIDELKKRKEKLEEVKKSVIECQCKLPIDVNIEVKRTASLAAICECSPEDKILNSCSCESLRSQLLSNLLSDLFKGLESELGGSGSKMPCQLLKCLEEKHNWNRTSIVKTNLRNFFSQLLLGELDIAIANSIEKYHAKWIGASCADTTRMIPDPCEEQNKGWEQRAIERRAQELASQLAEQLYQQRASQITKQAKDIVTSGPPPCNCKLLDCAKRMNKAAETDKVACYPCLVDPSHFEDKGPVVTNTSHPPFWHTLQDVTQLRVQIEHLKKDSIKKEDLWRMEDKITKLLKNSSGAESEALPLEFDAKEMNKTEEIKPSPYRRNVNTKSVSKSPVNKLSAIRKKQLDVTESSAKGFKHSHTMNSQKDRPNKLYKKIEQTYAVNMCLCDLEKEFKSTWKSKFSKDITSQISSLKNSKSRNTKSSSIVPILKESKTFNDHSRRSNRACFHKKPSNRSIDLLLEYLTKLKSDVNDSDTCNVICKRKVESESNKFNTNKVETKPFDINSSQFNNINSNLNCPIYNNETELPNSVQGINQSLSNITKVELPIATESVYIGAVNLDKSNDFYCLTDKVIKDSMDLNDPSREITNQKILEDRIHASLSTNNKADKQHLLSKKNLLKNTSFLQPKQRKSLVEKEQIKRSNPTPNKSKLIESVSNKKFSCPNDYYVKFLGVTLTNMNSHTVLKTLDNDGNNKERFTKKKMEINQDFNDYRVEINETKLSKQNHNNKFDNDFSDNSKTDPITSQDQVISTELNDLINKSFNKQCDYNKNVDSVIETQNVNETKMQKQGNCICHDASEAQNLEVNVFQLLEDHLKKRLEEFKLSSCKSACISPYEEEKLFSSVLKKVKQVIAESENKINCKCLEEEQVKGSWNRVHSLLQEYLKKKINRVDCVCAPTTNKHESILPNVLEKVHDLIDHDFKKLKYICKCQNVNTVKLDEKEANVPETDSLNYYNVFSDNKVSQTGNNIKTLTKISSNSSIILTQHISAQVPRHFGMETKSCDAMEKGEKNIQTDSKRKIKDNYITYSCDCSCYSNNTKALLTCDTNDIIGEGYHSIVKDHKADFNARCSQTRNTNNNLLPTANCHAKVSDNNEPRITPNLRYTVDKTLGTCTCIKSTVMENNVEMRNMWCNTKEIFQPQKKSYVLDSVPNVTKSSRKFEEPSKHTLPTEYGTVEKKMCDSKVSIHGEGDIFLIDSDKNLNVSYISAKTSNDLIGLCSSSTLENQGERYKLDSLNDVLQKTDIGYSQNYNNTYMHSLPCNPHKCAKSNCKFVCESKGLPKLDSLNCDCNVVPVCHVKMLVNDIESKLIHSKCTCDSLSSRVCPIHSITDQLC